MALTSQASTSANFQVRGFSTEPKQFRRVSIGDQRARKKSATERLTRSRAQFASGESQEELRGSHEEDDGLTELSGVFTACRVDVIPISDETESTLHSSISYVGSGDPHGISQPAETSRPLQPILDESQQDVPSHEHLEAGRGRVEIVQTSPAQSQSPNEDVPISPHEIDTKPGTKILQRTSPVLEKSSRPFPTRKHSGGVRDRTLEIVETSLKRSTSPVGYFLISCDADVEAKPVEHSSAKRESPVPNKSPRSVPTRKTSGGRDRTLEIVEASLKRSTSPVGEVFVSSDTNIEPEETFLTKRAPPVPVKSPKSFPTRKYSGGGRDRTLQIVEASLKRSTSPFDLPISPREKSFPQRWSPVHDESSHSIATRKHSRDGKDRSSGIVNASHPLGSPSDEGANISSSEARSHLQLENKSQPRRPSPSSTSIRKNSGDNKEETLETVTSLTSKSYGKAVGPSDHHTVEKSSARGRSPVFSKSPQTTPIRARGGSRDRTLEIVAASLALGASPDDGEISSLLAKKAKPSMSVSPVSSREETGGHVRKLKEHFLSVASTESENDSSHGRQTPTELQQLDTSPSSNFLGLEKGTGDHNRADHRSVSQKQRDVIHGTDTWQLTSLQGRQKLQDESQLKAVDHTRSRSTSSEEDPGLRNEKRGKSLTKPTSSSSDSLDEQTRRQMERFKARYAAADAAKHKSQEGKINRIIIKPPTHAGDAKERSKSVHDPAPSKPSLVRPRSETTKEAAHQPVEAAVVKTTPTKPKALYSITQHSKSERVSAEKMTNYTTTPKTPPASYETSHKTEEMDLKIPEMLTSDDVRRMRRAKQLNVSGKTPERWGDAEEPNKPFRLEEFHKPQRSVLEHAVYHGSDRTVVQVGGTVFPVKQEASDTISKENLQDHDPVKNSLPCGIHRRDKSTSDESSVERSSGAEEVTALLSKNPNQNDISDDEPLKPKSKHEASPTEVFYKHVMKSPQAAKGFKKTSWASVSFGQTQDKSYISSEKTRHNLASRVSPDMNRFEHRQLDKQTMPCSSSEQLPAPHDNREHAKSALQNFLSGIMTGPRSPEGPCSQTQQMGVSAENDSGSPPQNDGNGNCIVTDTWTVSSEANIDKRGAVHREVLDNVNSNFSFSIVNQNEPFSGGIVPPASTELTKLQRDPVEGKQSETVGDQVDASLGLESHRKMQHSREGLKNELEKMRKLSENSDASLSRRDGELCGTKEQTGGLTEKPRTKKTSLSDLLSQDVMRDQNAESSGPNEQSKKSEVDKQAKTDSKRLPPPKLDCYHGDDSESDMDDELRRSKVLRLKKSSRAEKRMEDNSLQNLLSRIINPEDELNTIKRGKKSKTAESSEMARNSAKDANSNRMYDGENATKLVTTQMDVTEAKPTFRKPLLNLNILQRKNRRPVRRENFASPPESMTSPIRRGPSRRRSKSDLGMSPRCSVSSAPSEVEQFFNQMGLNDSFFQSSTLHFSDGDDVFHDMHEYKHGRDDGSFSTEHSDNISQGSKVSEEGLHLANKLPDTSQSIITKNARVIKWLCQMKKARASSIS